MTVMWLSATLSNIQSSWPQVIVCSWWLSPIWLVSWSIYSHKFVSTQNSVVNYEHNIVQQICRTLTLILYYYTQNWLFFHIKIWVTLRKYPSICQLLKLCWVGCFFIRGKCWIHQIFSGSTEINIFFSIEFLMGLIVFGYFKIMIHSICIPRINSTWLYRDSFG